MSTPVALSQATLGGLPAEVGRPSYDRAAVRVGIVHIGVGGFHRAHQAMYLDRLLEEGSADDWGICGVGLLAGDARMAEVLDAQDGLYTLMERDHEGSMRPRVIGSIIRYLHAPADPEAVLEQMADPAVRIVSLTVTEGGYSIDAVTGEFDPTDPAVAADLDGAGAPRSTLGFLTEALRRRRDRGVGPFTLVSCDNLEGNGEVAKRVLSAFAERRDPELAGWIAAHVPCPNSMVDRITPVTTPDDLAELRHRGGVVDRWPVVCEPFTQWVLEDRFAAGRPPLQDVGVQVVDDVRPYELMKLRLLNASHQCLCYFAHLAGYRLVHEAASDPLFRRFLLQYMAHEGAPTLEPVPGIDLERYQQQLVERFSNPGVRDTIARLCAESSDRIPKWLLPVIRAQLAAGGPIDHAAAVVAAWARYAEGVDEQGAPIEVVDRLADVLRANAQRGGTAFIEYRPIFGDLADDARFRTAYLGSLDALHHVGARGTLEALVSSASPGNPGAHPRGL